MSALTSWAVLHGRKRIATPPEVFIAEVVSLVALRVTRAMPQALQASTCLVKGGLIYDANLDRLVYGLEALLAETDYDSWSGDDDDASRLTLTRAAAVKLAAVLAERDLGGEVTQGWLRAAEQDPMPEVRLARRQA